jgi:hypothetical protein
MRGVLLVRPPRRNRTARMALLLCTEAAGTTFVYFLMCGVEAISSSTVHSCSLSSMMRAAPSCSRAKQIADKLEELHFGTGANGGFILARGFSAEDTVNDFVQHVVPELQRRGLSKKRYAGPTQRENLNG